MKKEYKVGQVIRRGGKKYFIAKVNKNSLKLREFTDRKVSDQMRKMTLGDFFWLILK